MARLLLHLTILALVFISTKSSPLDNDDDDNEGESRGIFNRYEKSASYQTDGDSRSTDLETDHYADSKDEGESNEEPVAESRSDLAGYNLEDLDGQSRKFSNDANQGDIDISNLKYRGRLSDDIIVSYGTDEPSQLTSLDFNPHSSYSNIDWFDDKLVTDRVLERCENDVLVKNKANVDETLKNIIDQCKMLKSQAIGLQSETGMPRVTTSVTDDMHAKTYAIIRRIGESAKAVLKKMVMALERAMRVVCAAIMGSNIPSLGGEFKERSSRAFLGICDTFDRNFYTDILVSNSPEARMGIVCDRVIKPSLGLIQDKERKESISSICESPGLLVKQPDTSKTTDIKLSQSIDDTLVSSIRIRMCKALKKILDEPGNSSLSDRNKYRFMRRYRCLVPRQEALTILNTAKGATGLANTQLQALEAQRFRGTLCSYFTPLLNYFPTALTDIFNEICKFIETVISDIMTALKIKIEIG